MQHTVRSLLGSAVVLMLGYVTYGIVEYRAYSHAFAETRDGETLAVVLERFGAPSHIEPRSNVSGYDAGTRSVCSESCWLRLWYEMPFTLGLAPLTVDFDAQQKVIDKYEWSSP